MRLSFREFHLKFEPAFKRERVPQPMLELLGPPPFAKPVFETSAAQQAQQVRPASSAALKCPAPTPAPAPAVSLHLPRSTPTLLYPPSTPAPPLSFPSSFIMLVLNQSYHALLYFSQDSHAGQHTSKENGLAGWAGC